MKKEYDKKKHSEWNRKYYKKNRLKIRKKHRKYRELYRSKTQAYRLKKNFGMTLEDYNIMLESQNGLCAICYKPETKVFHGRITALVVDHCHETGKIRKLLCYRCNVSLGLLDDNPDRMRAMARYVESFQKRAED